MFLSRTPDLNAPSRLRPAFRKLTCASDILTRIRQRVRHSFELQLRRCSRSLDCQLILRPNYPLSGTRAGCVDAARSVFRKGSMRSNRLRGNREQARRSCWPQAYRLKRCLVALWRDSDLFESSDAASIAKHADRLFASRRPVRPGCLAAS